MLFVPQSHGTEHTKSLKKKITFSNMLPYGRIALFGFSVTMIDVYYVKFDQDNVYRNRACSTS